jgi:hypothetical protein
MDGVIEKNGIQEEFKHEQELFEGDPEDRDEEF